LIFPGLDTIQPNVTSQSADLPTEQRKKTEDSTDFTPDQQADVQEEQEIVDDGNPLSILQYLFIICPLSTRYSASPIKNFS